MYWFYIKIRVRVILFLCSGFLKFFSNQESTRELLSVILYIFLVVSLMAGVKREYLGIRKTVSVIFDFFPF